MSEMEEEIIEKLKSMEAIQIILHPMIRDCIKYHGLENTRDVLEGFSCTLSQRLSEECAKKLFYKHSPKCIESDPILLSNDDLANGYCVRRENGMD